MRSLDIIIFKNSRRRDERIGISTNEKLFSALSFIVVFGLIFEAIIVTIVKFINLILV